MKLLLDKLKALRTEMENECDSAPGAHEMLNEIIELVAPTETPAETELCCYKCKRSFQSCRLSKSTAGYYYCDVCVRHMEDANNDNLCQNCMQETADVCNSCARTGGL